MLSTQQTIANRYVLKKRLGAGSYAETWLAIDLTLNRDVAVKVLHSEHVDSQEDLDQFRHEVQMAASVSHPNVVATYDANSSNDLAFLVMEWVDGMTLKQEIRSRRRMDQQRAISVVDGLLSGLNQIHAAGIIHRDVKPQNVLVSSYGDVKLTDFGASITQDNPSQGESETTVGSAAYMAPEQAQGQEVTPAADIYAVGVIMYEMLTGRLPFTGNDPHVVIHKHLTEPVTRPKRLNPNIPAALEAIILRALAKDPVDRYRSAEEMRAELRNASNSAPNRRSSPLAERSGSSRAPRYAWVAVSLALMFVMIVGSTAIAIRDFTADPPPAVEEDPSDGSDNAQPELRQAIDRQVDDTEGSPREDESEPAPAETAMPDEEEEDPRTIAQVEDADSGESDDSDDREFVVTRSQGLNITNASADEDDDGEPNVDNPEQVADDSGSVEQPAGANDIADDNAQPEDASDESSDEPAVEVIEPEGDSGQGEDNAQDLEVAEPDLESTISEILEAAAEAWSPPGPGTESSPGGDAFPPVPWFTLPGQPPAWSGHQGLPAAPPFQ